jgi:hypothetical protein
MIKNATRRMGLFYLSFREEKMLYCSKFFG